MRRTDDANDAKRDLTSADRRLIATVAEAFRPPAMERAHQLAFRRRIEERLERQTIVAWRPALGFAVAIVAAALWYSPSVEPPAGSTEVVRNRAEEETSTVPAVEDHESFFAEVAVDDDLDSEAIGSRLYAFDDTDEWSGEIGVTEDDLPEELLALVGDLDV
ncbi:MAG: hypothetical protein ACREQQ_12335 [Candidatus Binatia bacterium]